MKVLPSTSVSWAPRPPAKASPLNRPIDCRPGASLSASRRTRAREQGRGISVSTRAERVCMALLRRGTGLDIKHNTDADDRPWRGAQRAGVEPVLAPSVRVAAGAPAYEPTHRSIQG